MAVNSLPFELPAAKLRLGFTDQLKAESDVSPAILNVTGLSWHRARASVYIDSGIGLCACEKLQASVRAKKGYNFRIATS